MKFYSEELKKFFDTEEDCVDAEERAYIAKQEEEEKKTKLAEERKARADEIKAAYEAVQTATKEYNELVKKFINDFGSYHMTYTSSLIDDAFNSFFKIF